MKVKYHFKNDDQLVSKVKAEMIKTIARQEKFSTRWEANKMLPFVFRKQKLPNNYQVISKLWRAILENFENFRYSNKHLREKKLLQLVNFLKSKTKMIA